MTKSSHGFPLLDADYKTLEAFAMKIWKDEALEGRGYILYSHGIVFSDGKDPLPLILPSKLEQAQ